MKYIGLIIFGTIMYTVGYNISLKNAYLTSEKRITKEMVARPTKYQDDFSFGYSVGLIKCSHIVYDVLRK